MGECRAELGDGFDVRVERAYKGFTRANASYRRRYVIPLASCVLSFPNLGGHEMALQGGDIVSLSIGDRIAVESDEVELLVIGCQNAERTQSFVSKKIDFSDESGGCVPQEGGFRRKLVQGAADGIEFFVLGTKAAHTKTHYHPASGPNRQCEFYVVLKPEDCGRPPEPDYDPQLFVCPGLTPEEIRCWEVLHLRPGNIVWIPPGVPHRAMDGYFGVLALPKNGLVTLYGNQIHDVCPDAPCGSYQELWERK